MIGDCRYLLKAKFFELKIFLHCAREKSLRQAGEGRLKTPSDAATCPGQGGGRQELTLAQQGDLLVLKVEKLVLFAKYL